MGRLLPKMQFARLVVAFALALAVICAMAWLHPDIALVQAAPMLVYRDHHPFLCAVVYFITFAGIAALCLPAEIPLAMAGGALFGFLPGLALASFAANIGALAAFLMARFFFRGTVVLRCALENLQEVGLIEDQEPGNAIRSIIDLGNLDDIPDRAERAMIARHEMAMINQLREHAGIPWIRTACRIYRTHYQSPSLRPSASLLVTIGFMHPAHSVGDGRPWMAEHAPRRRGFAPSSCPGALPVHRRP